MWPLPPGGVTFPSHFVNIYQIAHLPVIGVWGGAASGGSLSPPHPSLPWPHDQNGRGLMTRMIVGSRLGRGGGMEVWAGAPGPGQGQGPGPEI